MGALFPFIPGDAIRQRYQANASVRLVLATTENPDVVLVLCPQRGICHVLVWGHELVQAATPETSETARRLHLVGQVMES